jgi:hypothetical protein
MIRVLLDEDVDVRLRHHFDVLVTADRQLQYQQNVTKYRLGLVVLSPRSKALEHLLELLPGTIGAIREVMPGQVRVVEHSPATE